MARLDDGMFTEIGFGNFPSVLFYEKEITPPDVDAGGPNDTTTLRNDRWRTRAPKKLLTLGVCRLTVSYDPMVLDDIIDMAGDNQLVTITYPDGETESFYGWLDKWTPGSVTEGSQPTATIEICCSNQTDLGVETGPVMVA